MTRDRATWTTYAVVFAVSAVTFLPVLGADFLYWDDQPFVVENTAYRGFGLSHLWWMFTDTSAGGPYQPLGWLSYAVDHALWGLRPFGFHLTNLLLHATCAVAFVSCARRLLRAACLRETTPERIRLTAALAAAVWACHSLRVESVAWVFERRQLLCGLFLALSLRSWLIHRSRGPDVAPWRSADYGRSLAFYAAAMLSKATPMGWAGVLILLDLWPHRLRLRDAVLDKIPFVLVAIPVALMAWKGQSEGASIRGLGEVGIWERLVLGGHSAWFYVGKTLLPTDLHALYLRPTHPTGLSPTLLAGAAAAAMISVAAVVLRRRAPAAAVAWFSYLLLLAPVSGLVTVSHGLVADRFSYLTTAPLILAAVVGISCTVTGKKRSRWVAVAGCGLVLVLAVNSAVLATSWKNTTTLFERVLVHEPDNWFARGVLGEHHRREGRLEEAEVQFAAALRTNPDLTQARVTLVAIHLRRGRVDLAQSLAAEAVERAPLDPTVWYVTGLVHEARGRAPQAQAAFRKALDVDPGFALARARLAGLRDGR